jgi:hypothetical protein
MTCCTPDFWPALDDAATAEEYPISRFSVPYVKSVQLLTKENPMTQDTPRPTLPDHLSVDPRSPHHIAAVFEHAIGIRLNDKERNDVEEYCISEGWVKVPAGKTVDRKGQPLMIKLKGKVEAFYR